MNFNGSSVSYNASMLILKLISEKDMYGYEIVDNLSKESNNIFEYNAGELYPLLYDLTLGGYLFRYEGRISGKKRIYYRITRRGRKYLENVN